MTDVSRRGPVVTAMVALVCASLGMVTPAVARPDPGRAVVSSDSVRASPVVTYSWPVSGGLVVPFDPPATPWGSGHRGVDLAVSTGERVSAMADGTVGFAGVVAGRAWVSVDHPGGVRTTVGPMWVLGVAEGDVVAGGQVLGTAAGTAHADAASAQTGLVHVSARIDGAYVDPSTLVGAWVPTLVVPD